MDKDTSSISIKCPYDGKSITDSSKRTITLRKPNIMDRYNLNKCMKQDSEVPSCMNMMSSIIYVAKVNDRVYETPRTYEECLALLQNLGEEGVEAVFSELIKHTKEEPENIKK